jgi:hypothetical protein
VDLHEERDHAAKLSLSVEKNITTDKFRVSLLDKKTILLSADQVAYFEPASSSIPSINIKLFSTGSGQVFLDQNN